MPNISDGGKLLLLREATRGVKGKNAFHSQFTCKLQRDLEMWLTVWRKQTQFKKNETHGRSFLKLTICLFFCLILLLPWKFYPRLVGK